MREGFLVIDKPPGLTSHDVCGLLRACTGSSRVGHTGTLDPFASGVLPVAFEKATRVVRYLDEAEKRYDLVVQLGRRTDTGDWTGEVVATAPVPSLDARTVDAVLSGFLGQRMQVPPTFSAVKVEGKPLYAWAREGVVREVEARPVRIDALERVGAGWDPSSEQLTLRLVCSRGTYARVIAEEVGVALGTEAHLVGLRRTASGPFTLEGAVDLDAVAREVTGRDDVDWKTAFRAPDRSQRLPWRPRDVVAGLLERGLRPMRDVLGHLGWLELDDVAWGKLRTGQLPRVRPDGVGEGDVYLMGQGDAVAALARWEGDKPRAIVVLIGIG